MKVGLGINVLEAARQRIAWVFETFPKIYVSFSGGKDSTVMLHLVMDEAIRTGRKVGLLFIDWEAQFSLTIDHIRECYQRYAEHIDPHWVALPFLTTNACSMHEPEWICWQPEKRDLWVREFPPEAITDEHHYPFYRHAMTFEEFVPKFGHWYGEGDMCACLVGIRTGESLNRWRTIAGHGTKLDGRTYAQWTGAGTYNVYPIYDWRAEDIWRYHGKYPDRPHNPLYDRMHQAGLTINQMRICEPYGDEQRKGLWLYHVIEPDTWGRVVSRVAGANTGALYAGERGNVMGNGAITKPDNLTWRELSDMLLDTMPPKTADHYRDKIAVWRRWYEARGHTVTDELPGDTSAEDMPSWRRVCKILLRNDYWCKGLCFSPTKAAYYEKYKKIMKKRRQSWGIY
jgi:predicted phosphoadenosine phosphosulfate sulfurtransferase